MIFLSSNILYFSPQSIQAMVGLGHKVENLSYPFFNVVNGISKEGQCFTAVSDARKQGRSAGYWPCRQLLEISVVIHQVREDVRVEAKGQRSLSATPVDTINSNTGWLCTGVYVVSVHVHFCWTLTKENYCKIWLHVNMSCMYRGNWG